jgi:hypothetical protein
LRTVPVKKQAGRQASGCDVLPSPMSDSMFDHKRYTIRDLLFEKNRRLVIPNYQRPYTWGVEQIDDLWSDIILSSGLAATGNSYHFLGVFVFVPRGKDRFEIVDGQQRILSIIMILKAIQDAINSSSFTRDMATEYKELDSVFSHGLPIYVANKNVRNTLHQQLGYPFIPDRENPSAMAVASAYKRVQYRIKELIKSNSYDSLKLLYRAVTDQLQMMVISTEKDYEAYTLFETLNSRGVPLDQSDLVKNKIISMLSGETERSLFSEEWDKRLVARLTKPKGGNLTKEFLRHFCLTLSDDKIMHRYVYKTLTLRLDESVPISFAQQMFVAAENYARVAGLTDVSNKEIEELLSRLRSYKVTAHNTLLMTLLGIQGENNIPLADLAPSMTIIHKFSLRWTLEKGNAQDLENIYQSLSRAVALSPLRYQDIIINKLIPLAKSNEDLMNTISANPNKISEAVLKEVLYMLEESYSGSGMPPIESLELEHVAPRNPPVGTSLWTNSIAEDVSVYQVISGQIGNIILLESHLNREASNHEWHNKALKDKAPYRKSKLLGALQLTEIKDWNKSHIDSRNRWLGYAFAEVTNLTGVREISSFMSWSDQAAVTRLAHKEYLERLRPIDGETWLGTAIRCLPENGDAMNVLEIVSIVKKYKLRDLSQSATPENTLRRDLREASEKESSVIVKVGDNAYALSDLGIQRRRAISNV